MLITPLAAIVLLGAGAALGLWAFRGHGDGGGLANMLPKTRIDEKATLSVLKSEAMTFLVTRRTTTQVVVEYSESGWTGSWDGVLWVTVNWCWGVDMSTLSLKDLRREGDAIYCRIGEPRLLQMGIVPGSEKYFSRATFFPKLNELFDSGSQHRKLQEQIQEQAAKFAKVQGLQPTRDEIVHQLNLATADLKKTAGVEIRFE